MNRDWEITVHGYPMNRLPYGRFFYINESACPITFMDINESAYPISGSEYK